MSVTWKDKLAELRRRHRRIIFMQRLWVTARVKALPDAWYAGLCDEQLRLKDRPLTTATELGKGLTAENAESAEEDNEFTQELRKRVLRRADEIAERVDPGKVLPGRFAWGMWVGGVMVLALWGLAGWMYASGGKGIQNAGTTEMQFAAQPVEDAAETNDKIIPNDQAPDEQRQAAGGSGELGEQKEGDEAGMSGESVEQPSAGVKSEKLDVPEEEREHVAAMVDAAPPEYREAVAEYMLRIQRDSR